jgi:hypothetical protein
MILKACRKMISISKIRVVDELMPCQNGPEICHLPSWQTFRCMLLCRDA